MQLQDVDVIGAQQPEALLKAAPDSLRGEVELPWTVLTGFGADDDLVAASAQHFPQSPLGQPRAIGRAAVEEVDPGVQSSVRRLQRSVLVVDAEHVTQWRSAIPDNRHSQTSAAQLAILHRDLSRFHHRSFR